MPDWLVVVLIAAGVLIAACAPWIVLARRDDDGDLFSGYWDEDL